MVIGSVSVGRAEVGAITCTPAPGMAKLIVWPASRSAFRIACRSEPTSEPGTLSVVFVTWKGEARPTLVANFEVSLAAEVAVAVTVWPDGIGLARLKVAVK